MKKWLSNVGEFVKLALIATMIVMPVRYFIVKPFLVKGVSMAETFNDKDYLIIDEISYRFQEPRRGQVVVFRAPKDPSQYYLKRIIGLPGETVEVTNTHVRIKNEQQPDGFFLDEEQYLQGKPTLNEQVVTLGEDEYFVMGDNREQSLDSRVFGPVPEEFIVGKVWVRGWPLNQAGFIEETLY